MSDLILGIDLGTTNSVVALVRDGTPQIVPVAGHRILPSVVGISPEGKLLVGDPARNQWVVAPERTVRSIKRQMGSATTVLMAGQGYSPQEISAYILRALKEAAEAEIGVPVERAVITVPAYFTEIQRQATIEAGAIAGLTVERIINEPTAAALAYGLGKDDEVRALVYDLGGGTFDVSIIELGHGVIDVRATAGDNQLGGDDFDQILAEWLAEAFEAEHGIDLREDRQAWARLLRASEEAKIELSEAPYSEIRMEYLAVADNGAPLHLQREVHRGDFEALIAESLERTIDLIDLALADAGLDAESIDLVLLVGGSTRIPLVNDLVSMHLDQTPQGVIDPELAVALGAAVQAGIISGAPIDAILVDVTPFTLGVETAEIGITGRVHADRFAPLIRRNTAVPTGHSKEFNTLYPGQDAIHVKVYQGEDPVASNNVRLGEFEVDNLQPNQPDGTTELTIHFRLDINGILDVTVVDRGTGRQVSHQLKASRQRLSAEEITRSQSRLAAPALSIVQPRLDASMAALVARAEELLGQPDLAADLAAAIGGAVADVHRAADNEDASALVEASDALIDLLMEAEAG
jgi:molecular chaperone DnaK